MELLNKMAKDDINTQIKCTRVNRRKRFTDKINELTIPVFTDIIK